MARIVCIACLVMTLLASCDRGEEYDYVYAPPAAFADGIETAALESVGMESGPIREMMDRVNGTVMHRIHAILVMRSGRLVFEEYFQGYAFDMDATHRDGQWMQYGRETDHFMASVSKSVTSAIVGIAVQEGLLPDLEKKVLDYFPEYADILTGAKAGITLYHLLTMTSGLAFDENTYPYGDERNDVTRLFLEDDPIRFVLSKPLDSAPGERFFYNSGAVNVLAAIIARVAAMKFLDYANARLFDPLGTKGGMWQAFPAGGTFASGGLFLRARELAKIGQLFLDDGVWQGRQIVGAGWIAGSQQEHVATSGFPFAQSYGYLWWIREFTARGTTHRCFFAAGWGDQYLFIIPDLDMVIVFNCGNFTASARISPFDLVEGYILAAVD
jgi:CubicO group peptidase (beta-lactamase class C family)